MIPEGWVNSTFEDHIDLLSGFAFKSAYYSSDENAIRLLRGDNIEPQNLRWRNAKKWRLEDTKDLERYCLDEGDLIIAMDRTWVSAGLKVAEVKLSDLPCLLVQRVSRIRAKNTIIQNLLHQHFSSYRFEQHVKSVQTETAVPHISAKQIKDFSFLIPPLPEQKKIAKILSTWDKAITTTEQLIANSQQQKKALMQQLLTGKKRLAGFSGEWEDVRFDDILDIEIGGTPSRSNPTYWDHNKTTNNRWLSIRNLNGNLITDTSEYLTDLGVKNSNVTLISAGTVVMTFKLTIGRRAVLGIDCYTNEAIAALQIKDRSQLDNSYLFHALEIVDFDREIDQAIKGKTLNKAKLKRLILLLPEIEEQQKIAQVLTSADQEIETLQQKLNFLKEEKKALMQQLLTGKRRVRLEEHANEI